MLGHAAEIVQHLVHVFRRQPELARLALGHRFVLQYERDRDIELEGARTEAAQELERGPARRAQAGDQDAGIEDDRDRHMVSYTIPDRKAIAWRALTHLYRPAYFVSNMLPHVLFRKDLPISSAVTSHSPRTPHLWLAQHSHDRRAWATARCRRQSTNNPAAPVTPGCST